MAEQEPDPVSAVLNIPELLEAICLHLPTENIARSRRVSRFWKEVIDTSVKLQQALFLLPTKPERYFKWVKRVHHDLDNLWQPVLLPEPSEGSRLVVGIHPILEPGNEACIFCSDHASLKTVPLDTLLTQPPSRKVVMRHRPAEISIERESGVTSGAVLEKLGLSLLPDDIKECNDILPRKVLFDFPGLIADITPYVQSAIKEELRQRTTPQEDQEPTPVSDDQEDCLIPRWLM